jgi:signal peptidase II
MSRARRAVLFVAIFLSSAGFDQGSKEWARSTLTAHVPQPVVHGYWDWQLEQNLGAAFSTFLGTGTIGRIALSLVALIALIALGVIAARTKPDERLKRTALALIAGGALGNLVDRALHGSVTDFVRWHVHEHMWPIFNVADASLLVGVGLLALERAIAHRRNSRDRPSTA